MTFARFIVVGALTSGVYFGVLAVGLEILRLPYRLAVTGGYMFAITFQFLANRSVTFRAGEGASATQLVRFLLCVGLNYALTLAIVTVGVEMFKVSTYLSSLVSLLVTTPVGFLLSKNWVFQTDNV